MIPDEQDSTAETKQRIVASIDVCMGGHVAEEIYIGKREITSGRSWDFASATQQAEYAVNHLGMFNERTGFASLGRKQ